MKPFWNEAGYKLIRSGNLTHTCIGVVEYENCSLRMTEGCGNMGRVKLAWAVEKDSTKEGMLGLNIEG